MIGNRQILHSFLAFSREDWHVRNAACHPLPSIPKVALFPAKKSSARIKQVVLTIILVWYNVKLDSSI